MNSEREWVTRVAVVLLGTGLGCAGAVQQTPKSSGPTELATLEVAHQRQGVPLPGLADAVRPPTPVHASYRVCVDGAQGHTVNVKAIFEKSAADEAVLPALRTATWQVSGIDGPACFLENLVSNHDGTWRTEAQPYLLATSERITQAKDAAPALPEKVQEKLVGKSVVGLYRMCVAKDSGTVSAVTPVVGIPGADADVTSALRTWHYKFPSEVPCWIEPLMFTLNPAPEKISSPGVNAMPTKANSNVMNNVVR